MSSLAAAIDIGTNSVLLLVAERSSSGEVQVLHEDCIITRLGMGVDHTQELDTAAISRTVAALQVFASAMDRFGVDRCAAVGTSALRDAINGNVFTTLAAETIGCEIEVISGPREAALVARGVQSSFPFLPNDAVIFDVGGGSTEFIRVSKSLSAHEAPDGLSVISLDVGTVRLTERHIANDPPTPRELGAIGDEVRKSLALLGQHFTSTGYLVGVAGTVTTLLAIELGLEPYDSAQINGGQLSRKQVDQLSQRLARLTVSAREQLQGLPPGRADVIVSGALLVAEVMDYMQVDTLHVCDRGVRWGLLLELLGRA